MTTGSGSFFETNFEAGAGFGEGDEAFSSEL
jgi:hypothetical protein